MRNREAVGGGERETVEVEDCFVRWSVAFGSGDLCVCVVICFI